MSPSIADVPKMDATSHHHRLAGLYEFRLQSSKEDSERMTSSAMMAVTASSVCSDQQSFYKQRIDSMFDETRSSVSGGGTPTLSRRGRTVLDDLEEEDEEEYDDDKTPNTVQERIQKMFAEVTEDEENIRSSGGEVEKNEDMKQGNSSAPKTTPKSKTISAPVTNQTFSVHYLGSAPLPNRDATLQALQSPLKTLYFKYRKLEMNGRAPPLNGTLDISEKGLRVRISGNSVDSKLDSEREMDKLNKFPSIAVWAAVKFVSRKSEEDKENSTKYAFLPLIADPEGRDKSTLFQNLPEEEINFSCGAHSPMFAIVMRRSSKNNSSPQSVKKTLHCHAFVCACSEDAIVMAANLYQALVAGMSGGKKGKTKTREGDPEQKNVENSAGDARIRQGSRNTIKKAMSIDGGDLPGKSLSPRPCDVMSSASAPVRPPRKKKGSNRYGDDARSTNSEDLLSVEEDDEVRFPLSALNYRPNISSSLASLQSKKNSAPKEQSGDIFTKVAIPRSGSFLDHGAAVRRSSSMGLRDLFQEVRAQEGLTSLDDILEKIVDADGMSFARLKPLYREFLLKLAATLSRDELYQRSKNIMRRQASSRRRRRRRRVGASTARDISRASRMDDDSSSTYGDGVACTGGKFSWALCSSVSKMKPKSSKTSREEEGRKKGNHKDSSKSEEGGEGTSCNFEFTSVIFPSEERPTRPRAGSSSISSSLSSTSRASNSRRQKRKQFHAHRPSFNAGRSIRGSQGQIARSGSNHSNKENQSRPKVSTSEDSSDFFSFKRRSTVDSNTKTSSRLGSLNGTGLGGGRSSSGYVSCSDCSFDSESCNSDKCYCPQEPHKKHPSNRLRRKESMRSRRCGEHCRNMEMPWCCCEATRNISSCRARAGMGYACSYRGSCEATRCTAAFKCSGHGKHPVHHCDRCSGVRRCNCSSWRNTQCTENSQPVRIQCDKRSTKVCSSGGDCLDEDDWEDEDAAVVVEDGASATSSSSWRPGAAVPKSRMDVYATLPPPRPLPETPANGTSGIYERCTNKKHEVICRSRSSGMDVAALDMKQQKVLVVSARDQRGRVICMGRGDQPTLPPVGGRLVLPSPLQRCSKSAATEALSVKKSAEIAALFSDNKSNQKTEVIAGEEVVYTTLEPPKPSQIKGMKTEFISKRGYYSKSSLENTLGYLP